MQMRRQYILTSQCCVCGRLFVGDSCACTVSLFTVCEQLFSVVFRVEVYRAVSTVLKRRVFGVYIPDDLVDVRD